MNLRVSAGRKRREWLAGLNTREIVIYLMELRRASLLEPELSLEVKQACDALRTELARREWLAGAGC